MARHKPIIQISIGGSMFQFRKPDLDEISEAGDMLAGDKKASGLKFLAVTCLLGGSDAIDKFERVAGDGGWEAVTAVGRKLLEHAKSRSFEFIELGKEPTES